MDRLIDRQVYRQKGQDEYKRGLEGIQREKELELVEERVKKNRRERIIVERREIIVQLIKERKRIRISKREKGLEFIEERERVRVSKREEGLGFIEERVSRGKR